MRLKRPPPAVARPCWICTSSSSPSSRAQDSADGSTIPPSGSLRADGHMSAVDGTVSCGSRPWSLASHGLERAAMRWSMRWSWVISRFILSWSSWITILIGYLLVK